MMKYYWNYFFYYFLGLGYKGWGWRKGFYYLGFERCYERLKEQQRLKQRSDARLDHVLRSNIFFFPFLAGLFGAQKVLPTTASSMEYCLSFNLLTPFFPRSLSSSPQLYLPLTQQQQCIAISIMTKTKDPAVTIRVIQYQGVQYHTSLNYSQFLIRMEWIKVMREANDCMQTSPYMKTMFDEGGMAAQMVGMYAMKANISPMIEPIRSLRDWSWKYMPRLISPKSQRGMKTVTKEDEGNLYMGMLKQAYWKQLIFTFFISSITSLQSSGFFYFKNFSLSGKVISNSEAFSIFTLVQEVRDNFTASPQCPKVFYSPKDSLSSLSGWSMRFTLNVQLVYFVLNVIGWTVIQRIEFMIQNGLQRRSPSKCTWKVFRTVNFTYWSLGACLTSIQRFQSSLVFYDSNMALSLEKFSLTSVMNMSISSFLYVCSLYPTVFPSSSSIVFRLSEISSKFGSQSNKSPQQMLKMIVALMREVRLVRSSQRKFLNLMRRQPGRQTVVEVFFLYIRTWLVENSRLLPRALSGQRLLTCLSLLIG